MQEQLGRLMVSSPIGVWDAPASARVIERETVALLEQVPLFAGLSRRHLGRVASVAAPKHYLAGATLVRVGAPADAFYIILDGAARVEIPVGTVALEPGDFFGEMAALEWGAGFAYPRLASVAAATPLELLVFPDGTLSELAAAVPSVGRIVRDTVQQRLAER
jgi:CRP-like cAMP-binding protein